MLLTLTLTLTLTLIGHLEGATDAWYTGDKLHTLRAVKRRRDTFFLVGRGRPMASSS